MVLQNQTLLPSELLEKELSFWTAGFAVELKIATHGWVWITAGLTIWAPWRTAVVSLWIEIPLGVTGPFTEVTQYHLQIRHLHHNS